MGALLAKALEGAEDKLYREQHAAGTESESTPAQRRADAFGLWLEDRLQPRVQLVVHSFEGAPEAAAAPTHVSAETSHPPIAAPTLVTEDGSRVSAETSSRLCCDAEVVPIARGTDGSVLDVGRRSRTVGWRLRKALDARDGGCRFPGCGSRRRTHAHHITHWAHGGETAMDNLVLLCPFHHRAVHEGGWRVEMDACGVPHFFNPLGVRMPVVPEAPDIGGLLPGYGPADAPVPAADEATAPPQSQDFGLARWHGQTGIGPSTASSLWRGERIDWGWAMVCLWGDGGGDGAGAQAGTA